MTDIYAYCPICNKEDGKETLAKKVVVLIGRMEFHLICGHIIAEHFPP